MRALDRRIDIERKTVTQAPSGQEIETWSSVVTALSAAISPVRGEERYTANQYIARQQVEFRIRWSPDIANVNPLDRVIYPADNGTSPSPTESEIYDIIEVAEIGRREGLKIIAARRAEVINAQ